MARFYFHVRTGDHFGRDPEGCDLPDLAAARNEALQSAREIPSGAIKQFEPDLFDCFVIADESGRELATVSLKEALPKDLRS
jgi:hypothetical protein